MYKKFIAIDQYGDVKFIEKYPRKELTEYFGVKHADKMYCDPDARHIGYIVAGHWYEVMKISPMK
jgi:hypothetical protein